jgi:indoleamine 2,3-dioxygenase
MNNTSLNLADFGVSEERGFLPASDPLRRLSGWYREWENLADELPALLAAGKLWTRVSDLPVLSNDKLKECEYERAHLVLSFLAHGYVWEQWRDGAARPFIPAGIAIPLVEISKLVGRLPVLSYASYALHNWRRLDPKGPIALGNIALNQYFLGGLDEAWFTLVHVEIEAHAGQAIGSGIRAQEAALRGHDHEAYHCLASLATAQKNMQEAFCRMPEGCDPYVYYNRVRPWIHGWFKQDLLPNGVVYDGVKEFAGKGQKFRGETGAQSSIMPLLDAILGVKHESSVLSNHLLEMRKYMPPGHRKLLEAVETRPSIAKFVADVGGTILTDAYNTCLHWSAEFRKKHLEYAKAYIHNQAHKGAGNPTCVGTGGTDFIPSLGKHLAETSAAKIK